MDIIKVVFMLKLLRNSTRFFALIWLIVLDYYSFAFFEVVVCNNSACFPFLVHYPTNPKKTLWKK